MRDIAHIKNSDCKVIAINDNYQIAPWADILYACDLKWWDWHKGAPSFGGSKWTMDIHAANKYQLNYIEGRAGVGLCNEEGVVHTGGNSGFQAINLALQFGASRVVLTGYDMKLASNGASHWFGDHPDLVRSGYERWLLSFKQAADQKLIEIINCTRDTALDMFQRCPITEAL